MAKNIISPNSINQIIWTASFGIDTLSIIEAFIILKSGNSNYHKNTKFSF